MAILGQVIPILTKRLVMLGLKSVKILRQQQAMNGMLCQSRTKPKTTNGQQILNKSNQRLTHGLIQQSQSNQQLMHGLIQRSQSNQKVIHGQPKIILHKSRAMRGTKIHPKISSHQTLSLMIVMLAGVQGK